MNLADLQNFFKTGNLVIAGIAHIGSLGLSIYAGFSSGSFWAGVFGFVLLQTFFVPMFYPPPGE